MRCDISGFLLAAGSLAALTCTAPAAAQAQAQAEFEFSLPAQDLATSLRAVSTQTRQSIVVSSDLVRGRRAPMVSGAYTAEQAVRLLLAGSGLKLRRVDNSLVVFGPGSTGTRLPADVAEVPATQNADMIVVTGTHLRDAPPSSPVILIDRAEIERSGASSVEQLMRKLPQNSQGGVNQENFGALLPDQDVTDHGAGLNLRGLGQRATLVLLDGRRLAPSGFGSFVDVSLIPLSLIERVEILTDGASAIYGSDAVGGVVNFILRDRIEGFETTAQAGITTRGGGEQLLLSQAGGLDWGSGHGLLGYEHRREDEVRAKDRAFTVNLRPDTFLVPRERRHSVLGSVEQDISGRLRLGATGSYSHRSTERTWFQSISPLPIGAQARAEALTLAGELVYDFSVGWRVRLEGSYARSSTDQQQTQPGGQELVNARDVRNAVMGGALKADGPLFDLPGGTVSMALGVELRHETYRDGFESSAIARTVDRASRDVQSLFGEVSVPIVSALNRMDGVERLELSVAGRFDHYSRTGSTFDPKLGLLWSPAADIAVRVSYGTSFRAPLLSEAGGSYNVIYLPAPFIHQNPADAAPGSVAAVLQGSNPDVRPETSRTWSAGAELSPGFAPRLSLSLNYYSVAFTDRIALPTRFIIVVGDPAFEPIINRSPDVAELTELVEGAQLIFDSSGPGFTNGGATPADIDIVLDDRVSNTAATTTRGFDLAVRYAFDAGRDRFVLDANVNHVLAFDDRLTLASPISQGLDKVYGPLSWRARGGLGWSRGPWTGSVFVNHSGGYDDDRGPALVPVAPHTTVDFSLAYAFEESSPAWLHGTRLALYAENLFDKSPPGLQPEPSSSSGLGYDPVNASGRGRFVSLQLRKSW